MFLKQGNMEPVACVYLLVLMTLHNCSCLIYCIYKKSLGKVIKARLAFFSVFFFAMSLIN